MASSSNNQAAPAEASSSKNTTVNYPVFLVRSRQSLIAIANFINDKTGASSDNVGLTRIWRGFDGKDNNLTLVVAYKEIYPILVELGYGPSGQYRKHFKITPFDLRNYQYPASRDTNDLFIPIPPEIRKFGDAALRVSIEMKLHHAACWGIIPDKSWEIIIPLHDRMDSTSVRGMAFVNFHKDVLTVQDIAMIRVVMDDGIWQEFTPAGAMQDSKYPFHCLWAHKIRHDAEAKHAQVQKSKKNGSKNGRAGTVTSSSQTQDGIQSEEKDKGVRKERPMFAQNVKMVSLVSVAQPLLKDGSVPVVPMVPLIPSDPASLNPAAPVGISAAEVVTVPMDMDLVNKIGLFNPPSAPVASSSAPITVVTESVHPFLDGSAGHATSSAFPQLPALSMVTAAAQPSAPVIFAATPMPTATPSIPELVNLVTPSPTATSLPLSLPTSQ